MSIEVRDVDGGLGNIISGGTVVTDNTYVTALIQHLTQDQEKFKKYKYSISDYTATSEAHLTHASITLISEYCSKAARVNPHAIVAIVSNHDLTYGLARMWEMLSFETPWEKMVFRNRPDSEAWIRQRVKEKFGIKDLTFA